MCITLPDTPQNPDSMLRALLEWRDHISSHRIHHFHFPSCMLGIYSQISQSILDIDIDN